MCHTNFQGSLPSNETSEYWDNSRDAHYYSEAPTVNLDDSLQYTTDDLCIVGNNQSNAFQNTPFSEGMDIMLPPEDGADLLVSGTSYPFTLHEGRDTCETDTAPTDTGPSFQLPSDSSVHDGQNSVERNDTAPVPFPSDTSQSYLAAAGVSSFTSPSLSGLPHPSLFERHATLNVPTEEDIRSSVLPKLSSPSGHHFAIAENISREYYGSDPMAPRLLTSGMVRRTPSRQPIKSLDLDLGVPSTSKDPQTYLKTNDRAAAVTSKERCGNGTGELYTENVLGSSGGSNSGWKRDPVQGVAELMAFHSRQSRTEGVVENTTLPTNMAFRASARGSKLRQKVCCVLRSIITTVSSFFHYRDLFQVAPFLTVKCPPILHLPIVVQV